jgi:uncharacterized protein (DUF2267 family)
MARRDEAALKLLRWELEGFGAIVAQAMLRHPGKNLADAVELIEQEVPDLSPHDAPSGSVAIPPKARPTSELDSLEQEFQTFRHLLTPREAKEVEAELKELAKSRDREAIGVLRRRLRALSLQASFWSTVAAKETESNALALVILRRGGHGILAKAGDTAYLDQPAVADAVHREAAKRQRGTHVMHTPVGRIVVMNGDSTAIAALFRKTPRKDVVSVLAKTIESIEENKAAANRWFGDDVLASRYAETLLKLLQKTSF